MGAQLVVKPADFEVLLDRLTREPLLAADTEAASFHRYHDRVYLLQLSTRSETWIVDPLEVQGLPGLDRVLLAPGVEVVFHDADYDLRLLAHEFGYRAGRVFDTRVAAELLNEGGVGLATLLEKYFKVRLDKKFQRADWSIRPLSAEMLAYAATDTRYLLDLRDVLRERLQTAGRLAWAEEEFEALTEVRRRDPDPPEIAALAIKGARTLAPRELAVFRELYVWRDRLARSVDRAPFRIAGNETLFEMARHTPSAIKALSGVRGLGRGIQERHGEEIVEAIDRGRRLADADLPRFRRPPRHRHDPGFEARLERLKQVRTEESARLELAPGVLAPNWLLESIARETPRTPDELAALPGIRHWQHQAIGSRLLSAVT